MHLLAYWKRDNLLADTRDGWDRRFSSNQSRLHESSEVGDRLWLVSGRPGEHGTEYVVVGCMTVAEKADNPASHPYGAFSLVGDPAATTLFDPDGPDATDLLLGLEFDPPKPIAERGVIGQSLQTIRALSDDDDRNLRAWAFLLRRVP